MWQPVTRVRVPAGPAILTPFKVKFRMEQSCTVTLLALMMWTAWRPVPSPSMSSPWSRTLAAAGVLMMMALVPETSTPASMHSEIMLMALVIVTPPKPPGSSTLISPPVAVFEMAPANVLHGAVRLHGLASSPTPETQVRVAWACTMVEKPTTRAAVERNLTILDVIMEDFLVEDYLTI